MRHVNRLIFVTGALVTASLAVIHCGGDDAATPGGGAGTSSAGSSGAAGSAAGSGGSIASAGGAAGSSAGGGGAAGTAGGGAAGTAGAPAGDSGIKDATTTRRRSRTMSGVTAGGGLGVLDETKLQIHRSRVLLREVENSRWRSRMGMR